MPNKKIYLVKFSDKNSSESFYKIGITSSYDAERRFKDRHDCADWDIRIIKTAWGPADEVEKLEKLLQEKYPKNIWIEKKISGVTEIVNLSSGQVDEVIDIIKAFDNKWYKERHSHERSK